MPVNLTPKALVQTLDALLADGNLSAADAQTLTGGQALSAEQKSLIAGRLSESHFTSSAERDQVLGSLGLSAADLAPAGSSPALLDKVKTKLVDLAKSELYKPYDFKVGAFELGEHVGLDLRVKAQLIDGSDPLIAEDKHRAATTKKHQDQGEALTWAIAGGGIYPHAGFSASVPIGPASVSIGFSANAAIGYSVLAPYAHEAQAALELAKNLSADLPFSAEKATALEAGTEITLRGTGRIAASSSIGIGYELAKVGDLVSVGASFGSSAGASKDLELSLRLKRLDGNKMFVSVSKVATNAGSLSVGAHVGVDLDTKSAIPDMGGGLLAKAGDLAADQIDKQVEKWANLDFRATHSTSKSEKEVSSYVIDLSTEAGKSAYEDLLRLDFRKVDQLFADGDLSVSGAKLSDRVRTSGNELKLSFGPITLLRAVSSATKDHVELKAGPKGEETIDCYKTKLADGYSGILSDHWEGKRSMYRELVSTQRAGEAEPSYYYHATNRIEGDGHTSLDDVRRFVEFADLLGALDPDTKAMAKNEKFLESFDDTNRTVDVYINDAGLAILGKAAKEEPGKIMEAYAQVFERLDLPSEFSKKAWKTAPWLETGHEKHDEIMKLLAKGPTPTNAGSHSQQVDTNSNAYKWITGRHLGRDSAAYKASGALVGLIKQLVELPTPQARMDLLAEQDKALGLDFWKGLGAVSLVAGAEHVLVNELRIEDLNTHKDLVFQSEGAIQDPRAEINARLNAVG